MSELKPFNDPVLKQALSRALGEEKAPAALRERIARLAEEARTATNENAAVMDKPIPIRSWRRNPLYSLAAAAVLLIGLGTAAWLLLRTPTVAPVAGIQLSTSVTTAIIFRHDQCCAPSDHHGLPGNDPGVVGAVIATALHRTIWRANLDSDGWKFRGAGECPVAPAGMAAITSGHYVYDRDNSHVSIFSLPASLSPGAGDGPIEEVTISNHRIAGFRAGNELFLLVMDAPGANAPTAQQVDALIAAHKSEMAAPQTASRQTGPGPMAELLYDLH